MIRDLTVGCYRYEHVEALFAGTAQIDGVDASLSSAPIVVEIFRRMVDGDLDVAELGLTYFLRTFDQQPRPFMALPIFLNRNFRHSAIYVNRNSGIERPKDLEGKRIGEFALYGHDAGVWPKGILADEFGVRWDRCRWVIGGADMPFPELEWIPRPVPAGVDVQHTQGDQTLGAMLADGEIDALISVDVPRVVLEGSTEIVRLFPDYERVERDYYRRTGIFPMMHIVAVKQLLAEDAELMRAIYRGFDNAKELRAQWYRDGAAKQHMGVMTPWFSHLFAENRALLGDDWWPYGLRRNRLAVDTFLRYHYEQGLSESRLSPEDIFVGALLDS